jgi:hypothetical protein
VAILLKRTRPSFVNGLVVIFPIPSWSNMVQHQIEKRLCALLKRCDCAGIATFDRATETDMNMIKPIRGWSFLCRMLNLCDQYFIILW